MSFSDSSVSDTQGRFQDLLRHARWVLAGREPGRLATQKELADALCLAATMTGRYLAGETDFWGLRALTVERLAQAADLDVGSVFAWIRDGRDAALAHDRQIKQRPVAFSPMDHLRELARMLQSLEEKVGPRQGDPLQLQPPGPPPLDHTALRQAILERRGPDSGPVASLFDTLVASIKAETTLQRLERDQELQDDDWFRLQQLLAMPAEQLRERFAPGQTTARTEPLTV